MDSHVFRFTLRHRSPWLRCLNITLYSLIALAVLGKQSPADEGCLGPPFLLATFHEGNYVKKYSRNGCLLDGNVLSGIPNHHHRDNKGNDEGFMEFRSMVLGEYKGDAGALYIADATNRNSRVLVFGSCDEKSGHRPYLNTAVSYEDNRGIDHTYGICFDQNGHLYTSNQHSNAVLRFARDSFRPLAFPPAINSALATGTTSTSRYYQGAYLQFDVHQEGVRSIILVENELWIANEDMSGVVVSHAQTGLITNIISVENPIGLYYDSARKVVYVSSKGKHRTGAVYSFHSKSLSKVREYRTPDMTHPTGVVTYDGVLYVAEQVLGLIYAFDVVSGTLLGKIVKNVGGDLEQLILSPC